MLHQSKMNLKSLKGALEVSVFHPSSQTHIEPTRRPWLHFSGIYQRSNKENVGAWWPLLPVLPLETVGGARLRQRGAGGEGRGLDWLPYIVVVVTIYTGWPIQLRGWYPEEPCMICLLFSGFQMSAISRVFNLRFWNLAALLTYNWHVLSRDGLHFLGPQKCILIGDFRVVFCLCFKGSLSAKHYIWKLVLLTCKWSVWIQLISIWKASHKDLL